MRISEYASDFETFECDIQGTLLPNLVRTFLASKHCRPREQKKKNTESAVFVEPQKPSTEEYASMKAVITAFKTPAVTKYLQNKLQDCDDPVTKVKLEKLLTSIEEYDPLLLSKCYVEGKDQDDEERNSSSEDEGEDVNDNDDDNDDDDDNDEDDDDDKDAEDADNDDAQQHGCAAGAACQDRYGSSIAQSSHHCLECGLKIHCVMFCGKSISAIAKEYPLLRGHRLSNSRNDRVVCVEDNDEGAGVCYTCIEKMTVGF